MGKKYLDDDGLSYFFAKIKALLANKSDKTHTHKYAGSSSAGGAATSADKLTTAKTISLTGGAAGSTTFDGSANKSIEVSYINEAYMQWGGKSLSGSVTPIDAAVSNLHSANRFTFAKPAGITVEYSRDGGGTWTDYGASDTTKIALVSGKGVNLYIGGRSTSTTVNDKLRITLNASSMGVYTRLRKMLFNISTNYSGGSNVVIEKAMKGSETTFLAVGTYPISGWSGWNSIHIEGAFGGGNTQTSNIAVLRFTFGITSVNANQTSNALTILDIYGIGDTYWAHPSEMAKTGHLYSYDVNQNATFPANITANQFIGTASKATADANGKNIASTYATKAELEELRAAIAALNLGFCANESDMN